MSWCKILLTAFANTLGSKYSQTMRLSRCHLPFTISLSSPSTRRMCSSFLDFAIFGFAKWFTHGPADPTILLRSDLVCFGLLWLSLPSRDSFGCPGVPGHLRCWEAPVGLYASAVRKHRLSAWISCWWRSSEELPPTTGAALRTSEKGQRVVESAADPSLLQRGVLLQGGSFDPNIFCFRTELRKVIGRRSLWEKQRHYIPLWWMPIEILYISLLGKTAPHTTERNSRQENLNPNFTSLKSESLSLSLYKLIIWV